MMNESAGGPAAGSASPRTDESDAVLQPEDVQQEAPVRGGSPRTRVTLGEALAHLRGDKRFARIWGQGGLEIEVYAPRGEDTQTPHTRSEIYIVARGTGTFLSGEARTPFGPGDILFVPAGVKHRFEDFSDDFITWVIFYGPEEIIEGDLDEDLEEDISGPLDAWGKDAL